MARKALRDEASDRAHERYPRGEWPDDNFSRRYAYDVAYEATNQRLRQAAHRGAIFMGGRGEQEYWEEVARVATEKLAELNGDPNETTWITLHFASNKSAELVGDALTLEVNEAQESGEHETANLLQATANSIYGQIGVA